jgi:hypothetical protein
MSAKLTTAESTPNGPSRAQHKISTRAHKSAAACNLYSKKTRYCILTPIVAFFDGPPQESVTREIAVAEVELHLRQKGGKRMNLIPLKKLVGGPARIRKQGGAANLAENSLGFGFTEGRGDGGGGHG